MERESFEDEEIADYPNQHYVCVKVDREECPDVDQVYMTAVQALTRRGGWPMSMFLHPDGRPFTGGSYFPLGMEIEKDSLASLQSLNACRLSGRINRSWWSNKQSR